MKSIFKKFVRCNKGAAAVEMAIALPVFLMFTMVTMVFGHMYWVWNTMNFAVNEAGRYTMANPTAVSESIEGKLRQNLMGINSNDVTITVADTLVNGRNFKQIDASFSYDFKVIKGFFGLASKDLVATTLVPLDPPDEDDEDE